VHDGDRFFQVVASLATADSVITPRLDDLSVEWQGAATVRGTVFSDSDANGIFDGGDTGLGGVPVTLWLDDGNGTFDPAADVEIGTVPSAADGSYTFAEQRPGTYFVTADESALDPTNLIGTTTGNPPAAVSVGECGDSVVDVGWEFGATVRATVFSDVDGDGAPGGSEPGLGGVPVQLWLDDGDGTFDRLSDTLLRTVATDAAGSADFGAAGAGTFFVFVGGGDTPDGHAAPASSPNPVGPLALAAGDGETATIGFVPDGLIRGTVTGNRSGTPPLADVFVSLFLDDGDGVFDSADDQLVSSTLSSTDGRYAFDSLGAGDH